MKVVNERVYGRQYRARLERRPDPFPHLSDKSRALSRPENLARFAGERRGTRGA